MQLNNIHSSSAYSPIELSDKRIASGSSDGSISICSINLNNKEWKQDIKKEQAHNQNTIYSLCEISGKRLISISSDMLKIWNISENELTLSKRLDEGGFQVISLSRQRFAYSSERNVKIRNENTFDEIASLSHQGSVYTIVQLTKKEVLVSSCWSPNSIDFWDLNTYKKLHSVQGYYSYFPNHLIELQNGHIAVSEYCGSNPIVIINPDNYSIITKIQVEGYITNYSSICPWKKDSFIYVYGGKFLQISISNYSVVYKSDKECQLNGRCGMISIRNNYLVVQNDSNGFSIITTY